MKSALWSPDMKNPPICLLNLETQPARYDFYDVDHDDSLLFVECEGVVLLKAACSSYP